MAKKGHLFLGSTESQKNRLLWTNGSLDTRFLLILAVSLKTS